MIFKPIPIPSGKSKMRFAAGNSPSFMDGYCSIDMCRAPYENDNQMITSLLNTELNTTCPVISIILDARRIREVTHLDYKNMSEAYRPRLLKHLMYAIDYQLSGDNANREILRYVLGAISNLEMAHRSTGEMELDGHIHVVVFLQPGSEDILQQDGVFGGNPGYVSAFFQVCLANFFKFATVPGTFDTTAVNAKMTDFKAAVSIANLVIKDEKIRPPIYSWVKHKFSQIDYIFKDGPSVPAMASSKQLYVWLAGVQSRYDSTSEYYHHGAVHKYWPSDKADYGYVGQSLLTLPPDSRKEALALMTKLHTRAADDTSVIIRNRIQAQFPHKTPEDRSVMMGVISGPPDTRYKDVYPSLVKRSQSKGMSLETVPSIKKVKEASYKEKIDERNKEIFTWFENEAKDGRAYAHDEIWHYVWEKYENYSLEDKHIKTIMRFYSKYPCQVKLENPIIKVQNWLQIKRVFLERLFAEPSKNFFLFLRCYLAALTTFLGTSTGSDLLYWIKKYFLKSSGQREGQLNKILYMRGPSNSGKTAIYDLVFLKEIFGAAVMSNNSHFAAENVYNTNCTLWAFPDLNRNVTDSTLMFIQNLANGEETLEIKNKSRSTCTDVARPMIILTTWDLAEKFAKLTQKGYGEMDKPHVQFMKRMFEVSLPDSDLIMNEDNNDMYHSSPVNDCFRGPIGPNKLPAWVATYFFWLFVLDSKDSDLVDVSVIDEAGLYIMQKFACHGIVDDVQQFIRDKLESLVNVSMIFQGPSRVNDDDNISEFPSINLGGSVAPEESVNDLINQDPVQGLDELPDHNSIIAHFS